MTEKIMKEMVEKKRTTVRLSPEIMVKLKTFIAEQSARLRRNVLMDEVIEPGIIRQIEWSREEEKRAITSK